MEHKVPGWCLTVPTDAPHNYLAQVDMNEGYNDCRLVLLKVITGRLVSLYAEW